MANTLENIAQQNMETRFRDNPCRGIVLGANGSGELIQVSWIMGRSPNSQNRLYVVDGDVMRTEPADPSKVENPHLILYNAMMMVRPRGVHIISNGNQTDTLHEYLTRNEKVEVSEAFCRAMEKRFCEDDESTFTARITGIHHTYGSRIYMSVLKAEPFSKDYWISVKQKTGLSVDTYIKRGMSKKNAQEAFDREMFKITGLERTKFPTSRQTFAYSIGREFHSGYGYCLTTYVSGSKSLDPYEGEPFLVPIRGNVEDVMQSFWNALEPEWRVSVGGKAITMGSSRIAEPINRFVKVGGE